jgi:PAS domain S-box-containing protein
MTTSDLTSEIASHAALGRLTEAQKLSVDLINDLLSAGPGGLDGAIHAALASLGAFSGSDRTYIFLQTRPGVMDNTHEWCAPGIDPMIDMLQDLPMEMADPWWPLFERDGHVYIADVLELDPGDPLRATLDVQGIRSLLAVPMLEDGQQIGFMGYDSVTQVRSFLKGEIFLIRSVANIISTLLTRRRIEADVKRLDRIVRNTTNMVLTTDAEGRIEWANAAFEARTGFTLAEARGHKPGTLLQCPDTDQTTVARIRRALAEGQPITAELLNRSKSGDRYWVEMNIQPVHDSDGLVTGFMAIQTDTTLSRERALGLQRALIAEEAARNRLKSAVEVMQEAVILFDAEQRLVLWNERFRSVFPELTDHLRPGVGYRHLLEVAIQAGYLARRAEDPVAWLNEREAGFAHRIRITSMVHRDSRWYRQTELPTPDGGRIVLLSDVTDLKDAEQRALNDRARAMDASQDGIALLSATGSILYANAAITRLLAVEAPEAVIGLEWAEVLRFADQDEAGAAMHTAIARSGAWHGHVRLLRHDGSTLDADLSATRNADGGVLCFLRDISARLEAERERERLRADLSMAVRRADLSLVAMGLTHDFNNLLSAISAAAGLIEEDGTDQTRPLAEIIGTAVDQASGLIRRLMALGRQTDGLSRVPLAEPVMDAVSLVQPSLRPPMRLDVTLPDAPIHTQANATGIMQMVLNLCINARDAMQQAPRAEDGGRILVSLAHADPRDRALSFDVGGVKPGVDYARITITDTGPGMDPITRNRIFTPYFSTKGDNGTGLGVPIAAEVVRAHEGALHLDSAPGAGTRFVILLPVVHRHH